MGFDFLEGGPPLPSSENLDLFLVEPTPSSSSSSSSESLPPLLLLLLRSITATGLETSKRGFRDCNWDSASSRVSSFTRTGSMREGRKREGNESRGMRSFFSLFYARGGLRSMKEAVWWCLLTFLTRIYEPTLAHESRKYMTHVPYVITYHERLSPRKNIGIISCNDILECLLSAYVESIR